MSQWRVEVDKDICIGSGMCVSCAPNDFDLDTGRTSSPRETVLPGSEEIMDAAQSCPVEAIGIVDVASGKVLFPED